MPTDDLAAVCSYAHSLFPGLKRITVYGSSQYIHKKGLADFIRLRQTGLTRIHVEIESGDDTVLQRIKKGTHAKEQIEAGQWVREAGQIIRNLEVTSQITSDHYINCVDVHGLMPGDRDRMLATI